MPHYGYYESGDIPEETCQTMGIVSRETFRGDIPKVDVYGNQSTFDVYGNQSRLGSVRVDAQLANLWHIGNKIRETTTGPPPHVAAPPIARMNAREMRAGRAKGANAGRNSTRDDGWTCASGCANGRSTLADGCACLSRRLAHALRESAASLATGCAPCCAAGITAGRTLALMETRRCAMVGRSLRAVSRDLAGRCCNAGRLLRTLVLRCVASDGATLGAGCARCRRKFFLWWRRRRRPAGAPAKFSGDVVTAGLILSRVWFKPVPGSPPDHEDREASSQSGPQLTSLPNPHIIEANATNLTSMEGNVSYLGLQVVRIRDDADFTRHSIVQLRKQLENAVDGLEIKIDVLESTLVRKFADNQQNLSALETGLVRHFADNQQHLVDEVTTLKFQVAEIIECLKELRDAKKGEGKQGEGPSNRKGEGTSSYKKRRWFDQGWFS
ncbi:putative LRR receptor-like serine/threonine-protein kinase [Dorcoceras hygrometricum]|uniref:Putative LRR receptor-like serine/threonine-protein kinase n=1 Tax=Dorcoceras hygrometricum TaxID=472368 RepID=A0A2Z7CS99_9LAMI|nr:putative LRR receptor-like serine/threonine-protein kinase [Dorcoceras hygrometricum]